MDKLQSDFIKAWASLCKRENNLRIHCSYINYENEPLKLAYGRIKKDIPESEKPKWDKFFLELVSKNILVKNNVDGDIYPKMAMYMDFNFTSLSKIDEVLAPDFNS